MHYYTKEKTTPQDFMIPITRKYLTNHNRPALRNMQFYSIRQLKGIIAHWTANPGWGANAMANRNYFNTTTRFASAHYIVDDHSIVQCMPDHEVGYHVGAKSYKPIGEEMREDNLSPNYFTIGFEMCVNTDGDWEKTYINSVELARYLLNKYNFTINDLHRHYDITGKLCPRMMIEEKEWQKFKQDINAGLNFQIKHPIKQAIVNTAELNVRNGPGVQYLVVLELHQDDPIEIYEQVGNWYRIGPDQWLHKHYVEVTFIQKEGIVEDPTGLNVRSGPGMQYPVVEVIPDGSPVVIENQKGNWFKLDDERWAYYKLIKIMELQTGRVRGDIDFLNVRKGPGTSNAVVRRLFGHTLVKILDKEGRWLKIGASEWVHEAYIDIVE